MIRARKSLGQHFLRHPELLQKIAQASGAGPDDVVLEIGPGEGTLTEALLNTGAMVVAIERDQRLLRHLEQKFADRDFVLISGDALAVDWAQLVKPWTALGRRWLVAGNIPYYITTPLLELALTPSVPAIISFLVQAEVAERVTAESGSHKYGALSIGIQAQAVAEMVFKIGRAAFIPAPKVDSALLRLVPRSQPLISELQVLPFRRLVTSYFSFRRKTMLRATREALQVDGLLAAGLLEKAGIASHLRPEAVDIPGWISLLQECERTGTTIRGC